MFPAKGTEDCIESGAVGSGPAGSAKARQQCKDYEFFFSSTASAEQEAKRGKFKPDVVLTTLEGGMGLPHEKRAAGQEGVVLTKVPWNALIAFSDDNEHELTNTRLQVSVHVHVSLCASLTASPLSH